MRESPTGAGTTPQDLLRDYGEELLLLGRSPQTVQSYQARLRPFLRWLERRGIEDLRAVTAQDVHAYAAELAGSTEYATRTVEGKLSCLKRFFGWLALSAPACPADAGRCNAQAGREGRIKHDPSASLVIPRARYTLPEVLTRSEVRAMLEAVEPTTPLRLRNRAILEVLYGAGLRAAELSGLDLGDLEGELLLVRRGKGGKDRVIPIGTEAARSVARYLEDARPQLARPDGPIPALFVSRNGTRCSHDVLARVVRRAAQTAGLTKRATPHTLRHSFATHMVQQGIDVVRLARLLGHAKLTTTAIYTHVVPVDLQETHARCHPRETLQP